MISVSTKLPLSFPLPFSPICFQKEYVKKDPQGMIQLDGSAVIFFNCTIAFSLVGHLVFITDPLHPL